MVRQPLAWPSWPELALNRLRTCLLAIWILALAPAWAAQHHAVVMSAATEAYRDPAEAWAGFQAGQFRPVDPEVQAMGWAERPIWLVVRSAQPGGQPKGPLFLTVSPIPVSEVQAWVWDPLHRDWRDLGRDGISAALAADEARTQGITFLKWPAHAATEVHVLVKLQPIGFGLLRGRLIDNASHETLIQARGAGLGLVWCFMIVATAFGMQAFMLSRQWSVLVWTLLAICHAWVLGVYEGLWPLSLAGVSADTLSRGYSLTLGLITLAYTGLILKDFGPMSSKAVWRTWLGAATVGLVLAVSLGEWGSDSSLQGVLVWQLIQSALALRLLAQRLRAQMRPWVVISAVASALLLLTAWSWGALFGLYPYQVNMHHVWLQTQWVMVLWVGYILLNGTMTERRAARAERKRLNALLQQDNQRLEMHVQQRTAELRHALADIQRLEGHQRELLSLASHEFRTPAAIISSSLEVIDCLPHSIAPSASPYMDSVRAASKRLVYLANKLIDHDRWREMAVTLHREPLELRAWTQSLVADIPAQSQVVAILGAEPIHLQADSVLLRIALQNLIDNALLHNRRGNPVIVRLEGDATQVHLMVDDGGHGVPEALKRRVFERYVSHRDTPHEAHGLGLFIVHSIARQHSGTVQVCDAPGGGARFIISLPRASENNMADT